MRDSDRARFWARVDQGGGADACWVWRGTHDGRGYPRIQSAPDWPVTGPTTATRVSWAIANVDGDMCRVPSRIMATCGNAGCVNPAHLSDRTVDHYRSGFRRGLANANGKLSEADVRGICEDRRRGARLADIADKCGVTVGTLGAIFSGATWRHVTGIDPANPLRRGAP